MAKFKKPGTIEPATPSAPAPKATAPAGGGGAAKPKAAAGGTPRNPPPPPLASEQEPVTGTQITLEPEATEQSASSPDLVSLDRDRRERATRRLAERRSPGLGLSGAKAVAVAVPAASYMMGSLAAPAALPGVATLELGRRAAAEAGRGIGNFLVSGAQRSGLVDENTVEQYRKKLSDALPDWDIVGRQEGIEAVNPTGRNALVVRPRARAPVIGGSLAEYQEAARQREAELRKAQSDYGAEALSLSQALARPETPDASIPSYERAMREKLQRVADLRQSLRDMGYTEEEIKALQ